MSRLAIPFQSRPGFSAEWVILIPLSALGEWVGTCAGQFGDAIVVQ